MSDLGLGALSRDRLIARIEALEAELAAAKTVNREVLSRENDDLRKVNGEAKVRIEALEAALRGAREFIADWGNDEDDSEVGMARIGLLNLIDELMRKKALGIPDDPAKHNPDGSDDEHLLDLIEDKTHIEALEARNAELETTIDRADEHTKMLMNNIDIIEADRKKYQNAMVCWTEKECAMLVERESAKIRIETLEAALREIADTREAAMRQRSDAEIEAALTAYHGADGWDHNDRADMRAALAAADALVNNTSRIEAALRIWYPGMNDETMKLLKRNGTYELMGKVLAI